MTNEPKPKSTALGRMVRKLDRRNKRTSAGYVTNRDELVAILGEVSRQVSVTIVEKELPYAESYHNIAVEIKLNLTLERENL